MLCGQDSLTDVTCNILKLTQIVQQQTQASGKGSTFPIILANCIEILIGDRLYRALIDTGASRCVLSRNVVNELEELGVPCSLCETDVHVTFAGGEVVPADCVVSFEMKIDGTV